ncbi:hypothetical protein PDJAM_G00256850 [Pangasius djambal]|uniref:Uncharacterized protein n=1 Tax=Pangasius djambal TaxID=1691987 RepID=A0ACC5YKD6_9TELE|nr:hypothetical protein [Pangasius djambal]
MTLSNTGIWDTAITSDKHYFTFVGLQDELKECDDVKKSYNKLKADFDNSVSKLNDTLINQVFTIQALNQDIKKLEDKISSSEGNVDELQKQLTEKNRKLEDSQVELKELDLQNAQLIEQLADLSEQLNTAVEDNEQDRQQRNACLKKEEELSHLNNNTADVIDDNKRLRDDVMKDESLVSRKALF